MASYDIHRKALIDFWGLGDVQSLNKSLSDDEAEEILIQVAKDHDCNIGINWDVLNEAVRVYIEKKRG